jgi:radical SAM protein with 4Fe4S-binding SPASM domain
LHSITKGCLAGTAVCFVSHEGDVFPCGYLPVSAGNVRRQNFADIWRDAGVFNEFRDPGTLTGKCGRCEYKMVCSGCRARAFYEYGDYLAEEPYCAFEPARKD